MGRHPFALLKELHRLVGQPHVQLLVNELMGNAVKVLFHDHVIINVDLGLGPVGQLEGRGGQRQQLSLFQRLKPTVARALQLLKRLRVELGQQRANRGIQLAHIEKALVAQGGQNLPLGNLHSHLDLGFVARLFDPRGNDHGAVVFGHLLITAVQQRFITTRTNDPGLEIVGNRDPSHSAKESVSVAVSGDPGRQLFILEGFGVGLIARPQHRHKQMTARNACRPGHCGSAPSGRPSPRTSSRPGT